MDADTNDFVESLDKERKRLRIYMSHATNSDEYMSVLSYRVDQAIAATEQRLIDLKKLQGRYSA